MIAWQDFVDTLHFSAPSLLTAGALGISAGVLGVFVLLRRQSLAALAMPQAVAVGVALGLRLGWPTLPPALGAVALLIIVLSASRSSFAADPLLAACYVGGLCLSILLIANAAQHVTEMQNRFVGIDIAMSAGEAKVIAPALLALALPLALLWRRWLLLTQMPAVAELAGLHPVRWDYLFYALLATVVLLGTHSLGVVMVLSMVFLPSATVLPWVSRLTTAMAAASAAALLILAAGLVLSILMEWPLSQSIGGSGFVAMVLSRVLARFAGRQG